MTIRAVADTHTVIWYTFADSRLSPTARAEMDAAVANGEQIAISSISLAEMVYLVEKGRIGVMIYEGVIAALEEQNPLLLNIACDRAVVQAMWHVSRNEVPDFPDRIVAATAMYLRVPLISRDRKIQASSVTTIW
ncbi:MAG: type II toxin-antitoxin system VapC family toxin [Roseiflexaceae bacterium]